MRIEVGYGLEGTLTDALSKVIIANAITPRFKAGDFSDGVTRGVDDIITVLTTDASEWEARPDLRLDRAPDAGAPDWLLIARLLRLLHALRRLVGASAGSSTTCCSASWSVRAAADRAALRAGRYSGGGSWGGGGGGFSGGGGSSGGGGASGGW